MDLMQVVLVSATLPHEILEMTNKFMTDPVRILVKRDELTLEVGYFDLNLVTTAFFFIIIRVLVAIPLSTTFPGTIYTYWQVFQYFCLLRKVI